MKKGIDTTERMTVLIFNEERIEAAVKIGEHHPTKLHRIYDDPNRTDPPHYQHTFGPTYFNSEVDVWLQDGMITVECNGCTVLEHDVTSGEAFKEDPDFDTSFIHIRDLRQRLRNVNLNLGRS